MCGSNVGVSSAQPHALHECPHAHGFDRRLLTLGDDLGEDFGDEALRRRLCGEPRLLLVRLAERDRLHRRLEDLGEPVLVFNVYNPDKQVITDFSKRELLVYANAMFFVSNTRRVFEVLVTVTQIDIALFSITFEQLVSIGTVSFLVHEKQFHGYMETA